MCNGKQGHLGYINWMKEVSINNHHQKETVYIGWKRPLDGKNCSSHIKIC